MTLEMFPLDPNFDESIRSIKQRDKTVYSIVDIIAQITGSKDAAQYWRDTKKRLQKEGFESQEKILSLKAPAKDGKLRYFDFADAHTCLRIIQSIPSPKAEPIRQWLATLAVERLEQQADPELGVQRSVDFASTVYRKQGKDDAWIESRQRGILKRKTAMDAAALHAAEQFSYGELTNIEYVQLFRRKAAELKSQLGGRNPRDSMTRLALIAIEWTEAAFEELLKQRGSKLTRDELYAAMRQCAGSVGATVQQMQSTLGIDLATGKPLLPKGD
jgi:hypothetical protein